MPRLTHATFVIESKGDEGELSVTFDRTERTVRLDSNGPVEVLLFDDVETVYKLMKEVEKIEVTE